LIGRTATDTRAEMRSRFRAIDEPWRAFRRAQYAWFRINETCVRTP